MLLFVLFIVILPCAYGMQVPSPWSTGSYHQDVGIPLAAKIKDHEEKMMADNKERVIGGALAPQNGHPYFAGLLIDLVNINGQSICGSSVLSRNRLVTAAHCWEERSFQAWRFHVILGTPMLFFGGERIMTTRVITHPQYDSWTLMNDVAMIYLPENLRFTESIQPITLPVRSDVSNSFDGQLANAVGFGFTRDGQAAASSVLSHVNLRVITLQQCRARAPQWASSIFPSMMCTSGEGGVGLCSGDSGGPLAVSRNGRPLIIGIASFAAVGECEDGWPSGYARVTSFIDFFNQHLQL